MSAIAMEREEEEDERWKMEDGRWEQEGILVRVVKRADKGLVSLEGPHRPKSGTRDHVSFPRGSQTKAIGSTERALQYICNCVNIKSIAQLAYCKLPTLVAMQALLRERAFPICAPVPEHRATVAKDADGDHQASRFERPTILLHTLATRSSATPALTGYCFMVASRKNCLARYRALSFKLVLLGPPIRPETSFTASPPSTALLLSNPIATIILCRKLSKFCSATQSTTRMSVEPVVKG